MPQKNVGKGKLFTEVRKVKLHLKKIELKDLTEDNDLFYIGAKLVTKVFEKNKRWGETTLVEKKTGKST